MAKRKSDWRAYFYSIRESCPWSWRAWQQGDILICDYDQGYRLLQQYQAIVYITGRPARQTKKFAKKWQCLYPHLEFLVSAPEYGPNGTPEPVIIQQDLQTLRNLRDKLGVKNPAQ